MAKDLKANLQRTSWTMGSAKWEARPAAADDYKWPEPRPSRRAAAESAGEGKAAEPPVPSIMLGADPRPRYTTASSAAFAAPSVPGRQDMIRPDGHSTISLGSERVDYATSTGSAYVAAPVYKPPKVQAEEAVAGGATGARSSHLVLGDDAVDYRSTQAAQNEAATKIDVAARAAVRAEMEERKRVLATKNIAFGSDAPDYTTTARAAMLKEVPKREARVKVDNQKTSLVLGDDATEYVSAHMTMTGSRTKKLGQTYNPKSGASCARED